MSHLIRFNFLSRVVFLVLLSKAFPVHHAYASEQTPYLTSIIINSDSVISIPPTLNERDRFYQQKMELIYTFNNIEFELTPSTGFQYQFFLEGFDAGWNKWKPYSYKEYTNLPAGTYTFKARYRDPDNKIGELPAFTFRILYPWYISPLAIITYSFVFILILTGSYLYWKFRFTRKQYTLEQIIAKRTEALMIEKRKTEELLENVLPK